MIIPMSPHMIAALYPYWGIHFLLLKDKVRMETYHRAIEAAVKPNHIVVDIGSGTGILSFLAAKAGARRVYAVERGRIISLAEQLAKINGLDKVIQFVPGDSRNITIPEKADLIVSELIGIFALHENMLPILIDARNRLLNDGGNIIPSKINLSVIAIESATIFDQVRLSSNDLFGLDFSPADSYEIGSIYAADFLEPDVKFLSNNTMLSSIDLQTITNTSFEGQSTISIRKAGIIHGVGGFWEAKLFDSVSMSTAPTALSRPNSWLHAFFPVEKPFQVDIGDEITFQCCVVPDGEEVRWKYNIKISTNESETQTMKSNSYYLE